MVGAILSITLTIWLLIVVVVLAAAAFAFRTTLLDMITSRKGYTVVRDIRYGPHERQKLDLYLPSQNADRAALIVFLYGGAWSEGSKAIYRFVAQPFASRGFLVAVPDYRLFPEVVFPAFVEDAARAVAFLVASRPLPAGGPRRLILVGHSAGAHSAALLATDRHYLTEAGLPPDPIDRMIGLAGPYDFKITKPRYKAVFPPETRAASQPISFVDGHRTADAPHRRRFLTPTVDPGNTTRFAQRHRRQRRRRRGKDLRGRRPHRHHHFSLSPPRCPRRSRQFWKRCWLSSASRRVADTSAAAPPARLKAEPPPTCLSQPIPSALGWLRLGLGKISRHHPTSVCRFAPYLERRLEKRWLKLHGPTGAGKGTSGGR